MKRLEKTLKYPRITAEFSQKLERRRTIALKRYRLINDILEKPSKVESVMIQNFFTKILNKVFKWLVIKDQTI